MERISQSAFARRRGVSKQYINKLVRAGKIPVGDDGMIDPVAAESALEQISDPARELAARNQQQASAPQQASFDVEQAADDDDGGAPAQADGGRREPSYNHAAVAHKTYQAKLSQLEYEKAIGNLVDRAEVEREAFDRARATRDRVVAVAQDVAGTVKAMAAASSEQDIAAFLRKKLNEALAEAADHASVGG